MIGAYAMSRSRRRQGSAHRHRRSYRRSPPQPGAYSLFYRTLQNAPIPRRGKVVLKWNLKTRKLDSESFNPTNLATNVDRTVLVNLIARLKRLATYDPFPPRNCSSIAPMVVILCILFGMLVLVPIFSPNASSLILPGILFFICCSFFCTAIMGHSIELQLKKRLVQRNIDFKRIISEVNRTIPNPSRAKFTVGPYGAYIILFTWGTEAPQGDPRQQVLSTNLVDIIGRLLGLRRDMLTNLGLFQTIDPAALGQQLAVAGRQGVISDTIPPIIDKYVDRSTAPQPMSMNPNNQAGRQRIEIGGEITNEALTGNNNNNRMNAIFSSTPMPYMPSITPKNQIIEEEEKEECLFSSKGGNRIPLKLTAKQKRRKSNPGEGVGLHTKNKVTKGKEEPSVFELQEQEPKPTEREAEVKIAESVEFDFESFSDKSNNTFSDAA